MKYLDGIPPEVIEVIRPYLDPAPETLAAISTALVAKRYAATTARTASGIESIWTECEEAYIGIDDANRGDFTGYGKWSKPMAMDGPVQAGTTIKGRPEHKSTVFLRLTARYVDAGAAKLAEILLPSDDKAFSISGTPIPDLLKAKEDTSQVVGEDGTPYTRPAKPGDTLPQTTTAGAAATATTPTAGIAAPQPAPTTTGGAVPPVLNAAPSGAAAPGVVAAPGAAGSPPTTRVPLTVKDLAEENMSLADKKAKRAETRIYDWLVESRYRANMRKVIFDSARLGSGVLKGPCPKVSEGVMTSSTSEGVSVRIKREIKPGVSYTDVWNLFPDPSCGEDIHNGEYIFERDYMSDSQVLALKKLPGYIESQIDLVLQQEIPATSSAASGDANVRRANGGDGARKGRREIWYYYGTLTREQVNCMRMAAGGYPLSRHDVPPENNIVHVIATMIGDIVVRAVVNPLDSGRFPYHLLPWQRRAGYWAGVGVAEQARAPQRILNASVRALLNNAGKSSGSQIVIDQGSIRPANGSWALEPDKIWYKLNDSPMDDVRKSFYAFDIPNMTDEMLKIIEFAEKQAENVTSIPLVTQGQSGATTPDTFSGMQLQDNNANQLLRSIGNNTDDYVTEPLITQCYEWLLMDPDVPDEEKGDFKIDAHGSSALVERAIQDVTLASLGPITLNPAYGIKPRNWMSEYLRSRRIDPKRLQYTEEEQQRIDSQPPPKAPQVEAAEILAQSRMQISQGGAQVDLQQLQAEQQMNAEQVQLKREQIQMERENRMLEYANKRGISLDQVKAELAKTAMTLQAQRELAAIDHSVDLHKHHNKGANGEDKGGKRAQPRHKGPSLPSPSGPAKPIAQLPGRAANGQAFTQAEDNTVTSG